MVPQSLSHCTSKSQCPSKLDKRMHLKYPLNWASLEKLTENVLNKAKFPN